MHPELRYQLMHARVADWHARAQRDALARAARRARRSQPTSRAARLPAAALTPGCSPSGALATRHGWLPGPGGCAPPPSARQKGQMTQMTRISQGDAR